jgi:hypothetical protein
MNTLFLIAVIVMLIWELKHLIVRSSLHNFIVKNSAMIVSIIDKTAMKADLVAELSEKEAAKENGENGGWPLYSQGVDRTLEDIRRLNECELTEAEGKKSLELAIYILWACLSYAYEFLVLICVVSVTGYTLSWIVLAATIFVFIKSFLAMKGSKTSKKSGAEQLSGFLSPYSFTNIFDRVFQIANICLYLQVIVCHFMGVSF